MSNPTYLGSEKFNPTDGYSATVPSGCNAIVAVWSMDMNGTNGATLSSISLGGLWSGTIRGNEPVVSASYERNTGAATFIGGSTGAHTLSFTPGATVNQGPHFYLVYLTVDTPSDFHLDTKTDNKSDATAPSVSVSSSSTGLVYMLDTAYAGLPSTASGFTSLQTANYDGQSSRLSSADSPGASSTTCAGQNPSWSAVVAVAIKGAAASGAPQAAYYRMMQGA